jgi:hypothetical protein
MALLHRVTAFLMAILLAELLLVGSGYACTMSDSMGERGIRAAGDATSPAAVVTAAPTASAGDDCPDPMPAGPTTERTPAPDQPPCPFPWAPAGCHGVPCAPATLATAVQSPLGAALAVADQPSLSVLPPTSVVRAPELPPPRA